MDQPHILVTGDAWQYVPFGRARLKSLRATGLSYASQSYTVDGTTIKVRIVGDQSFIQIDGGPLWVLATLQTYRTETSGVAGAHVPGSQAVTEATSNSKTWLFRSSLDFASTSRVYYGEESWRSITTSKHMSDDESESKTEYERTVVKGAIGALKEFAVYGGDYALLGGGASQPLRLLHREHLYREGPTSFIDTYDDSLETSRFLVGKAIYGGSTGGVRNTHEGGGNVLTDTFTDQSSGFHVRSLGQTNDDYAVVRGKYSPGPDDTYFKLSFDYEGGEPQLWSDPPDELLEWPHVEGLCQGADVDWGSWIAKDKYMGHPTTGDDAGKLWRFHVHVGVPHKDPPLTDSPQLPAIKILDARKMPVVKESEVLLAALDKDYSSGGELSTTRYYGSISTAGFNTGRWQKTTITGPNDNNITEGTVVSLRVMMARPKKNTK